MLVIKGSAEANLLTTASKNKPMGEIDILQHDNFQSILDFVAKYPTAVMFSSYIEFISKPDFQKLLHFEDAISTQISIGLPRGSELRRCLDFHILDMKQSGILKNILDKWLMKIPQDMSNRIFVPDAKPLGFDNLFFLAIIITIGCGLSLTLLLIEKGFLSLQYIMLVSP